MIYLAGPYTSRNPELMQLRFDVLNQIAAHYLKKGVYIFSPITHGHPIENSGPNSAVPYDVWTIHGLVMLSKCDAMLIVDIPGAEKSGGLNKEIEFCKANKIEHTYLTKDEIFLMPEVSQEYYKRIEELYYNE